MTDHPEASIIPFNGKTPKIHPSAFIAPGCRIIGDVEIGPDVSIWYNCVIRADVNFIHIGARTNIQDGTVVHCDSPGDHIDGRPSEGWPTVIGEDVLIGHMAMVHGCILKDRAFVGLGAIVMSGCTVESDAMLAAGALLSPGKTVPHRQLWAGRPAKYMRDLSDEVLIDMREGVEHYVHNGKAHKGAVKAAFASD
ncbi:gamma carbonic anhydrase family protein [Sphingobium sp. SJ10-10]|uniref:gamma carbonic anhydrase family protein n=1 Tax=unclassified Sphingobium TaxID=2611147 RepID=UPI0007704C62|nr:MULTISPECIES: gamma carbonic anhydrase family protein [Sphingomonadaceae]AMK23776.1 putative acetyltransferase [Sphingobium sp. TKS]MEC6701043.1 gamma carbonic anhydrase family protein [Sphingobium sp. SJ10-10]NML89539.1 gamma carbonic anhydrase family protein [Sphingobium sp. TB-6]